MFGLGLFIPANDILWFEGWILLILFFLFFSINALYFNTHDPDLVQKRSNPEFKEKWDKILGTLISFVFFPIFVVPGFDKRYNWSNIPSIISTFGFLLFILGYLIIFLTLKENTFLSKEIEIQEDHRVITTGPYKILRHPMYLGLIVLIIGWCLALRSLVALLIEVIGFIGLIIRTILEDRMLYEDLEGYKEYIQKTKKKLIPFVW